MKLPAPFLQLPLRYEADVLAAEVEALGEAPWRPHPAGFPGNSMLPLLALGGDAGDEGYAGLMLPTPELLLCPYLVQVLASFGATLGRTRLMRLAGQAEVTRHVDQGYYWAERVRIHVPIVTQPTVRFECGSDAINMAAGECWLFDTWRQHRVLNDASRPRIHLVADSVGGEGFWRLVARSRSVPGPVDPNWRAEPVAPVPGAMPELALESVNLPVVMSPWEMEAHFRLIFGEADSQQPGLAAASGAARRFALAWKGLWARYGTAVEGHEDYRRTLAAFLEEVEPAAARIQLRNGINCMSALLTVVAKVAVGATAGGDGEYTAS
jgi:hypothetical protein